MGKRQKVVVPQQLVEGPLETLCLKSIPNQVTASQVTYRDSWLFSIRAAYSAFEQERPWLS